MNNNNNNQEVFFKPLQAKFIRNHPDAVLPTRNHQSDTGYDLTSVEDVLIPANGSAFVDTGLSVADTPYGVWFLILPRSGLGFKHGIQPHLGVIDNSYRGSLGVKLYNFSNTDYQVNKGHRVAQLAYLPLISLESAWAEEATYSDRGDKGFGASGK